MSTYGFGNGGLRAGTISGMSDEKPDQAELALREFLRQRLENAASPRGVHLSREELSQWAASRDDTTAEDAVRALRSDKITAASKDSNGPVIHSRHHSI